MPGMLGKGASPGFLSAFLTNTDERKKQNISVQEGRQNRLLLSVPAIIFSLLILLLQSFPIQVSVSVGVCTKGALCFPIPVQIQI